MPTTPCISRRVHLFGVTVTCGVMMSLISSCENPAATPQTGQVVYWTDQSFLVPIAVKPNGQPVQIITTPFSARPGCGQAGAATYTLTPGSYSVTAATADAHVWSGDTKIESGVCLSVRLYSSSARSMSPEVSPQ